MSHLQRIFLLVSLFSFTLSAEEESFWEKQFSSTQYTTEDCIVSCLDHHSQQNSQISNDFLRQVKSHEFFYEILSNAQSILEVGCGSGEMIQSVAGAFHPQKILGVDISHNAIRFASMNNIYPFASFLQFDCLNTSILNELGRFELCICSNTLEHFKRPFVLLENILDACQFCIVLVPYMQPVTDGYDMEGGAGHVYTFDENSFAGYEVISWFTFQTAGWQHSSKGEKPQQLALLLSRIRS